MREPDQLIKAIDPMPDAPAQGPGARDLRDRVTAFEPERRRRWRRPLTLAALTTAVASAALLAVVVAPPPQAGALEISRSGDDYVVEVKDVYADPEKYRQEFRDRGIDLGLSIEPVSPSMVGGIVRIHLEGKERGWDLNQQVDFTEGEKCQNRSGTCLLSFRVPSGYRGGVRTLAIGRPAQPGERYETTGWMGDRGEILECVPFLDMTVAQVRAKLAEKGVSDVLVHPVEAAEDWWVTQADSPQQGKAVLTAAPEKQQDPIFLKAYKKSLSQCPK
jgi:hypothetical protein